MVARYAADFNLPFAASADFGPAVDRVRAACEAIDRDPDDVTVSGALVLCLGEDEAEIERRAGAIGREADELRTNGAAGTVDEVAAKLAEYAAVGCSHVQLQVLDLADLDHVTLAAERLLPLVADL